MFTSQIRTRLYPLAQGGSKTPGETPECDTTKTKDVLNRVLTSYEYEQTHHCTVTGLVIRGRVTLPKPLISRFTRSSRSSPGVRGLVPTLCQCQELVTPYVNVTAVQKPSGSGHEPRM